MGNSLYVDLVSAFLYCISLTSVRNAQSDWTKSKSFTKCSLSNTITVADPGFSPGGAPTPKSASIFQFFAKNCMKMKEFGPPGGGRVPGAPLGSANA